MQLLLQRMAEATCTGQMAFLSEDDKRLNQLEVVRPLKDLAE